MDAHDRNSMDQRIEELETALVALEQENKQLRQKAQQLLTNETKLSEVQRMAAIGSWEVSIMSGRLDCSEAALPLFGAKDTDHLELDDLIAVIHPEDRQGFQQAYETSVNEEPPCEMVHRLVLSDGEVRIVNHYFKTFFGSTGLPLKSIGLIQDITEKMRAEETLRQSEQRLQTIFESSPIGVAIVNRDGRWEFVNSCFVKMLGTSRNKFLASKATDWYANPEDREGIYERLLKEGRLHEVEIQASRSDGTLFWVLVSFEPTEKGSLNRFFVWVSDITKRRQAREEIRNAKEMAENALENLKKAQAQLVHSQKLASLGQLTAGIAHEIKNPLNFVNNFAETSVELIEEMGQEIEGFRDRLEGTARENMDELFTILKSDLSKIRDHGRRADGIVKSMLLHARGDRSDRTPMAINPLVSEATKLAFHGERATDKSFQVTLEEHLDKAEATADVMPAEITRVLVNLMGNAFYAVRQRSSEATDKDYEPTVSVSTRSRDGNVEIRVRDNGSGIPEDIREKIFEPFFTTKPAGEGTGLGLSMCYDIIVHEHGGQMEIDSKPGEFTEFSIVLPRHAGD
jgi:PAS domain S-box-containing protein